MYEMYSRQSLPNKEYRELLGSALCVFNSNNAFVIENILRTDLNNQFNWHDLIDLESGKLKTPILNTITKASSNDIISNLFSEAVNMRNRIIHSFQITDNDGEQRLATKDKKGNQFIITEDYLFKFISVNEELSIALHEYRGF